MPMFSIATPDSLKAAKTIADAIDRQTLAINTLHETLVFLVLKMDEALEKLRLAVEASTTVSASAVTLIQGIVDELRQHAGEEAVVNELADKLAAGIQPLADAVTANTP